LVAFGISGTSSGVLYGQFFRGHDPQLLLGSPRPIRSDEWLVAGPLTVAQVQEGLPPERQTGGAAMPRAGGDRPRTSRHLLRLPRGRPLL